jgi:FAD/FMN-containing dehydrogenase
MIERIAETWNRLGRRLPDTSRPGEERYAAATAIWAKPAGPLPQAVVHCRTAEDVQLAVRAAQDRDLPLSVRGGGHDWAGRALCGGIVLDLSGMRGVALAPDLGSARIGGGARAADVVAVTDPLGRAPVAGAVAAVGMAGFTLGGGYGALIGRCGLALDNLLAAEVVLADGRTVYASPDSETELFWALRGGGGNFGVVTAMQHRLHPLPTVHFGMLLYPFAEASTVLGCCAEIAAATSDDLSTQLGLIAGPNGGPVVFVAPTWCGRPEAGEAAIAPFLKLGTQLAGFVKASSYGASLSAFDAYIVNGRRVVMDTCWLPALDRASLAVLIAAMATAVSPGCALITHDFKGAATRVPREATAFGLRREHVLVEILATFDDSSDEGALDRHLQWARTTRHALDTMALPGGYPNLLAKKDERAAQSFGDNAGRLVRAKRSYDPDNVFHSALPLPHQ